MSSTYATCFRPSIAEYNGRLIMAYRGVCEGDEHIAFKIL
jgi:hypothetical protein